VQKALGRVGWQLHHRQGDEQQHPHRAARMGRKQQ
jgi:hypothetical protein